MINICNMGGPLERGLKIVISKKQLGQFHAMFFEACVDFDLAHLAINLVQRSLSSCP